MMLLISDRLEQIPVLQETENEDFSKKYSLRAALEHTEKRLMQR